MNNFSLDFLKQDFVLNEVAEKDAPVRVAKKNRSPEPDFIGLRVWGNGAVFPSASLVTMMSLEYSKAKISSKVPVMDGDVPRLDQENNPIYTYSYDASETTQCGLDVFDTADWAMQWPASAPRCLCVCAVLKSAPKVDLFKTVGYKEVDGEGIPVTTVLEQGLTTFGKSTLLPMLRDVYGIELSGKGYVDLQVATDHRVPSSSGIYFIPKKVKRGEDAGKPEYLKRENVNVYPLVPAAVVDETPVAKQLELSMPE